jgi:CRP/FNR family transcriptional regulator, cyclic AMP receptor protein
MEIGITTPPPSKALQDPLSYLPCSTIMTFNAKQSIFVQGQASTSIYLVIAGKVKVLRTSASGGSEVLVDIYQSDEFFGESALIGLPYGETAVAMEKTQVMTWSASEIERIAGERPKLAIALLQLIVQRSGTFETRIEGFAVDSVQRRLATALIRFSNRFGHETMDGAVVMMPLTHDLLAKYMGTSREIATHFLNQFRRLGHVRYSRQEMVVYPEALKQWLKQGNQSAKGTEMPLARRDANTIEVAAAA